MQTSRYVQQLTELRRDFGRASEPFEITVVPHNQHAPEVIDAFAEVGVDRLVLVPPTMTDDDTENTIALGARLNSYARTSHQTTVAP